MRRWPAVLAAVLLIPAALAASGVPAGKPDARRGAIAYRKCYSCHALEPGKNLEGPSLYRIVGRRIAAERGFAYSPALRDLARRRGQWDAALLDLYIKDPEQVAPRTSMNFHGIRDARERADLIAYLRQRARWSGLKPGAETAAAGETGAAFQLDVEIAARARCHRLHR